MKLVGPEIAPLHVRVDTFQTSTMYDISRPYPLLLWWWWEGRPNERLCFYVAQNGGKGAFT